MEPSTNQRERERKAWKLLKKKVSLKRSRSVLKKKKNLIHDIRLIEKQFRSIETERGSPKI